MQNIYIIILSLSEFGLALSVLADFLQSLGLLSARIYYINLI